MTGHFYKSTHSGANQSCVEVAHHPHEVLIRDSKYTGPASDQPVISIPTEHWPALLKLALNRQSGTINQELALTLHHDGGATLQNNQNVQLSYTAAEWEAFLAGVRDGEFDRTPLPT